MEATATVSDEQVFVYTPQACKIIQSILKFLLNEKAHAWFKKDGGWVRSMNRTHIF